jgi:hypothetical protein
MVWFSEVDLRMAAGPAVFSRGSGLLSAVRDVETTADGVRALVRGSALYKVFLGPSSPGLYGECDCPFSTAGNFCKHCVALGLVLLARGSDVLADASGTPQVVALQRQLDAALWVRGSVDRAGSLEYARIADDFLDTVEKLIGDGHAAEARPLARRAVERISESLLLVDDAPGTVAAACQRALGLYARACAVARPNGVKLAGWLFQLQLNSPGWPVVNISDFADALGETGLANYRALVDEAWDSRSDSDESDIRGALSLLLMRERLANRAEPPAVVDELPDPAVFLGVSTPDPVPWLVEFLVQAYLDGGRPHDALEIRRSQLRMAPTRDRYAKLRETAAVLRQWPLVRPWALDILRAAPTDELVGALLDDNEIDEAWQAATHGCAPELWLTVARERAQSHPADVLPGYRTLIDACAAHTGRRHYREAVGLLRELRDAASRCGQAVWFGEFVAELRARHRRKSAFLDELAQL